MSSTYVRFILLTLIIFTQLSLNVFSMNEERPFDPPKIPPRPMAIKPARDGAIDPTSQDLQPLVSSSHVPHRPMATKLARDGAIDPTSQDLQPLVSPSHVPHRPMATKLASDGAIDPTLRYPTTSQALQPLFIPSVGYPMTSQALQPLFPLLRSQNFSPVKEVEQERKSIQEIDFKEKHSSDENN